MSRLLIQIDPLVKPEGKRWWEGMTPKNPLTLRLDRRAHGIP